MRPFGIRRFWELLRTRQFKRFIWHVGLECGSLYAALVRAGPMLYAVAQRD
ncbi:MAG TPA: hypothetical protein VHO48_13295 [Anaerolineaceae bacterium]|nr:hypothetical protein [Anaerolineaceae bacterium]